MDNTNYLLYLVPLIPHFLLFLLSAAILLWGARAFVDSAVALSQKLKLSPTVIGATVVAIGTSLPELAIAFIASPGGDRQLALGNATGSTIITFLLVGGIGILLGNVRVGTTKTQKLMAILVSVVMAYAAVIFSGVLPHLFGLLFVGATVLMLGLEYHWGVDGRTREDRARFTRYSGQKRIRPTHGILSLAALAFGGWGAVYAIEHVAAVTGLSTTLLGQTVSASATTLPELMTTIVAVGKHQEKLVVGNAIGSGIYNILLISGVALAIGSGPLGEPPLVFLAITVSFYACVIVYWSGRIIPKWIGLSSILLHILYLVSSVAWK